MEATASAATADFFRARGMQPSDGVGPCHATFQVLSDRQPHRYLFCAVEPKPYYEVPVEMTLRLGLSPSWEQGVCISCVCLTQ